MNTLDSLRLMVRNYPGGITAVALRLGKSKNTLEKELANAQGHKLGALDACAISSMCIELGTPHCRAYAHAVAAECGGFVELQVRDDSAGSADANGCTVDMVGHCAKTLADVTVALSDKLISDNELKTIERGANLVIDSATRLVRDAREINAAGKPVHIQEAA